MEKKEILENIKVIVRCRPLRRYEKDIKSEW
jgi:hypothetical protein